MYVCVCVSRSARSPGADRKDFSHVFFVFPFFQRKRLEDVRKRRGELSMKLRAKGKKNDCAPPRNFFNNLSSVR